MWRALIDVIRVWLSRRPAHIPVPDLDELREAEVKRKVRIERDIAELDKLQAERAARADRDGQIPPAS